MFAFVHIYKSAGTTFKFLLRRNFGARHFETGLLQDPRNMSAAQLRRIRWIYPRLISIAGHEVRPFTDLRQECPDIRFYTFLREPKARLISAFRTKAANRIAREAWRPSSAADIEPAFIEFANLQRRKMCKAFAPSGEIAQAIEVLDREIGFVGIVERFDQSIVAFREWTGLSAFDVRYRRLNLAASRPTAQHRFRPFGAIIARTDAATIELATRPVISELLDEITEPDRALYTYAVARKFTPNHDRSSAGNETLSGTYEDSSLPREALFGRVHRNLLARKLVPLLTRSVKPFPETE